MSRRQAPSAAVDLWAEQRAPDVLARAEAEAVAALRDALIAAGLRHAGVASRSPARSGDAEPLAERLATESPPAVTPSDTRELLWAYCVVHHGEFVSAGVPAVANGRVEVIEAEGLATLVSRVPAAQFDAEPLTRNLNDLNWLERVAREHERVLDAALAHSTIVPLRMCTLFEDPAGVQDMLRRERDTFNATLDALEGRLEWAVKVLVDRDRLAQTARSQSSEAPSAASGGEGSAYLQRRRTERSTREATSRLAADIAQQVHARLQDWAIDARIRPPQNRELSGHEGEMVLNAAYLVERERTDKLREIVAELEAHHRRLGARIELTGPWPPYNFVPLAGTSARA